MCGDKLYCDTQTHTLSGHSAHSPLSTAHRHVCVARTCSLHTNARISFTLTPQTCKASVIPLNSHPQAHTRAPVTLQSPLATFGLINLLCICFQCEDFDL